MAKTWYYYSAAVAFLFLHCATAQTVHVVGDTRWIVLSDPNFYTTWASSKTFHLNDVLWFDFTTGEHDVVEVPKESYDSCSDSNKIGDTILTGPYDHTLNTTGNHYFICSIGNHCKNGQKFIVNFVSGSSTDQTVHVVGDNLWIDLSDPNFYNTWASSKTFHLNDVLSFEFTTGEYNVVEVPKESYDSCSVGLFLILYLFAKVLKLFCLKARELFYYLKGGQVDYGEEHNIAYGHSQFGRIYEQVHYPKWDEDHPIHFVGHSAGAQVARVLQQMLADKMSFKGYEVLQRTGF
ncbi:hypothetical protein K1719_018709 [Acacia pycnantha]|nr:hypothetical protein K1719_018709 [Acacia pycnantha]